MSEANEEKSDFTRSGLIKTFVLPALWLFLIPALSLGFFLWAQADYDARMLASLEASLNAEANLTAAERAALLDYFGATPVSEILATGDPAGMGIKESVSSQVLFDYACFRWFIIGSAAAIGSGLLLFVLGGVSLIFCLRSQEAQYLCLAVGWPVLRLFATFQVVAQALMVFALSYYVTALWMGVYVPKLIGFAGIFALIAIAAIIKAIFVKLDDTFTVEGRLVSRDDAPALWTDLDRLCEKVGTAPPHQVIAGIDDNFFVTEHTVTVRDEKYSGRTLFVSLPLLRHLDGIQADAVMAHEMAHFSGNDTTFSKKIAPLLGRYESYLQALSQGMLTAPVFYFMLCFRGLYQISLNRLGREREFRADKIAGEATAPQAIADSLIRITAYSTFRGKIESELIGTDKVVEQLNIAQRVRDGFTGFINQFSETDDFDQQQTSHPFDSHPPLGQRLATAGCKLTPELLREKLTAAVDGRWFRNIPSAERLEKDQWDDYEERFRNVHEQLLAHRYMPDTPEEKALVERHFPEQEFEGAGDTPTLFVDYDQMDYGAWEEPLLFSEITTCSIDENAVLTINFGEDGMKHVKLPTRKFQADSDEIVAVFDRYLTRQKAAIAFKEEQSEEKKSAADETKSSPVSSEPDSDN